MFSYCFSYCTVYVYVAVQYYPWHNLKFSFVSKTSLISKYYHTPEQRKILNCNKVKLSHNTTTHKSSAKGTCEGWVLYAPVPKRPYRATAQRDCKKKNIASPPSWMPPSQQTSPHCILSGCPKPAWYQFNLLCEQGHCENRVSCSWTCKKWPTPSL